MASVLWKMSVVRHDNFPPSGGAPDSAAMIGFCQHGSEFHGWLNVLYLPRSVREHSQTCLVFVLSGKKLAGNGRFSAHENFLDKEMAVPVYRHTERAGWLQFWWRHLQISYSSLFTESFLCQFLRFNGTSSFCWLLTFYSFSCFSPFFSSLTFAFLWFVLPTYTHCNKFVPSVML